MASEKPATVPRVRATLLAAVALVALDGRAWGGASPPLLHLPLGLGLALIAWYGRLGVVALAVSGPLLALVVAARGATAEALAAVAVEPLLAGLLLAAGWAVYRAGRDGTSLDDPHAAMRFLLLFGLAVPGLFGLAATGVQPSPTLTGWLDWALAAAVGVVVLGVPLLVLASPADGPTRGDAVETAGLALAAGLFSLGRVAVVRAPDDGLLWTVTLLPVVWAAVRQGLRGATLAAAAAALIPLVALAGLPYPAASIPALQAGLLGQGAVALLVAASFAWVRRAESDHRRVVGRVPVVLYSARVLDAAARVPRAEVTLVGSATGALFGRSADALLGDYARWLDLVHPDDRELVQAALIQLTRQPAGAPGADRSPPAVVCEYRLAPSPDRPARWLRDALTPRFDPAGALVGWDGVVTDVTEQRVLAEDLRRTANMFHVLVTHLPAGVFFVQGAAGRPILVNARARQLLGQREDADTALEHLARAYRLHRPDGTPYPVEDLPVYQALRHGRATMRDDIVVHRPDGRRVPLISWAAPLRLVGRDGDLAAVWVLEDVSALRRAEEILRETIAARQAAETRYQRLVEAMPVMVLQFDAHLNIEYLNPSALEQGGYAPDEVRDPADWMPTVHPDDLPRVRDALERALAGEVVRFEARYKRKAGGEGACFSIAQPRWQDGRITGVMSIAVDLTRERQLERELQHAHRLDLIGRLASGVAHDFQNLLTVILNLADLARDDLPADHPAADNLTRIAAAGEQAANVARQLLNFSRQRVVLRDLDLNAVARATLDLLRPLVPPNVTLAVELAGGPLPVRGDETQLQQVLLNLCLNARDAMPHGGRLRVATAGGASAVLVVEDEGLGMSDEVRQNLFRPFFTTKEEGHGLGLSVVQMIVESHGGRIAVASEPGRGSRFEVTLPSL